MLSSPTLLISTSPSTGQSNLQRLQRALFSVLTRCQCVFYTVELAGLPVVLKFLKCHRCPEIVLKSAIVLKFYSFCQNVLIWTLIFKFVTPRVASFKAKMHQIRFRLGLRPRLCWGSLQCSPRPPPRRI